MMKMNPIKYVSKDGMLKICKLSDLELQQVRAVLESLPSALLNKVDSNPIILDTGCSRSATGFIYDFWGGTIVHLCHTHLMGGIGASLEATHEVTLHYEMKNMKVRFQSWKELVYSRLTSISDC